MSNAELIANARWYAEAIREDGPSFSYKDIAEELHDLAAALEKSEAEVVRLGGVIAEIREDAKGLIESKEFADIFQKGMIGQARKTLKVMDSATVSTEGGAK